MKLKYIINPEENICEFHRELSIENIDQQISNDIAYLHCNIKFGNYNNQIFEPLNLVMYSNYKIILQISNSTLVDQYGRLPNETETPEECVIGEYDFFVGCLNNNVPLATVLENGINASILRGRHNI